MIGTNISSLRRFHRMTQEELAERLGITRQAVAKWESESTSPDIESCAKLAEIFGVSLDDLVNYPAKETGVIAPPRGKHFFGAVTIGERGQMVIPKRARELFNIQPGDQLLVLGDEDRGLALVHQRDLLNFVGAAAALPFDVNSNK